jgi:hypothetical protein
MVVSPIGRDEPFLQRQGLVQHRQRFGRARFISKMEAAIDEQPGQVLNRGKVARGKTCCRKRRRNSTASRVMVFCRWASA